MKYFWSLKKNLILIMQNKIKSLIFPEKNKNTEKTRNFP